MGRSSPKPTPRRPSRGGSRARRRAARNGHSATRAAPRCAAVTHRSPARSGVLRCGGRALAAHGSLQKRGRSSSTSARSRRNTRTPEDSVARLASAYVTFPCPPLAKVRDAWWHAFAWRAAGGCGPEVALTTPFVRKRGLFAFGSPRLCTNASFGLWWASRYSRPVCRARRGLSQAAQGCPADSGAR